jgi:hypothetical protein
VNYFRNALVTLGLLVASGCSGADESAATASTDASGERLLAAPPNGWKEVFSSDNQGLRMVEFIPDDQVNAAWQQKISFESSSSKPLPDPINFFEGLSVDQRGTCDGFESFAIFSGFENGYPTTLRLMVCKNSNIINQSQVTMLKAIQGKDNFYVISRAQRGSPLADDAEPLSEVEIAGWSLYLKAISLCDDSPEHPCPEQS